MIEEGSIDAHGGAVSEPASPGAVFAFEGGFAD
jgi:hypothetical protein